MEETAACRQEIIFSGAAKKKINERKVNGRRKDRMEQMQSVERWGVFEVACEGPSGGNPFTEQWIRGTFSGKNETVTADGFYDGDGCYKVRFMPSLEGV